MKVYKKIEYMTSSNRLEKIICDLCKAETTNEWRQNNSDNSDVIEINISISEGYIHKMIDGYDHDEGEGTKTTIDLCPDCFKSKLLPWVVSHGGVPQKETWEY